jgi:hypothetical protein
MSGVCDEHRWHRKCHSGPCRLAFPGRTMVTLPARHRRRTTANLVADDAPITGKDVALGRLHAALPRFTVRNLLIVGTIGFVRDARCLNARRQ